MPARLPDKDPKQKVTCQTEGQVIAWCFDWMDLGFPVERNSMVSEMGRAVLDLVIQDPADKQVTLGKCWCKGVFSRVPAIKHRVKRGKVEESKDLSNASATDEQTRLGKFRAQFQELKRKHGVTNANVYIVSDHGYVLVH